MYFMEYNSAPGRRNQGNRGILNPHNLFITQHVSLFLAECFPGFLSRHLDFKSCFDAPGADVATYGVVHNIHQA